MSDPKIGSEDFSNLIRSDDQCNQSQVAMSANEMGSDLEKQNHHLKNKTYYCYCWFHVGFCCILAILPPFATLPPYVNLQPFAILLPFVMLLSFAMLEPSGTKIYIKSHRHVMLLPLATLPPFATQPPFVTLLPFATIFFDISTIICHARHMPTIHATLISKTNE